MVPIVLEASLVCACIGLMVHETPGGQEWLRRMPMVLLARSLETVRHCVGWTGIDLQRIYGTRDGMQFVYVDVTALEIRLNLLLMDMDEHKIVLTSREFYIITIGPEVIIIFLSTNCILLAEKIINQFIDQRTDIYLGSIQLSVPAVQSLRLQQRGDDLLHFDNFVLELSPSLLVLKKLERQAHA